MTNQVARNDVWGTDMTIKGTDMTKICSGMIKLDTEGVEVGQGLATQWTGAKKALSGNCKTQNHDRIISLFPV